MSLWVHQHEITPLVEYLFLVALNIKRCWCTLLNMHYILNYMWFLQLTFPWHFFRKFVVHIFIFLFFDLDRTYTYIKEKRAHFRTISFGVIRFNVSMKTLASSINEETLIVENSYGVVKLVL